MGGESIVALLRDWFGGDPEQIALVQGRRKISYQELRQTISQHPASSTVPVPVVVENDLDSLLCCLQQLDAGNIPALLHPAWPEEQRRAQRELLPNYLGEDGAIFFSSGSTGQPKGIHHRLDSLLYSASSTAEFLQMSPQDRVWLNLSLAHVGGFQLLLRTLRVGACLILPERSGGFRAESFVEEIKQQQITCVSLVPTMLFRIVQQALPAPESLRLCLLGGAPSSPELIAAAIELGWPVVNSYGMTETAALVAAQWPPGSCSAMGEVGRPLPGVELKLEQGHIFIRSRRLALNYLPQRPLVDAEGWFDSQDLGALSEQGTWIVRGRSQQMIISGGENVYPLEVEALLGTLPYLQSCLVFGLPDSEWGQTIALAYIPTQEGVLPRLRQDITRVLAPAQRPRYVAELAEFALGPTGKLDRRQTQVQAEARLVPLTKV